jgi:uncharacterized protein (DUF58 family)
MMVPSQRLLLVTGLCVVPLSTAATMVPAALAPCLCLLALFLAVAAWDLRRGFRSLDPLSVSTQLTQRLIHRRPGVIPFEFRNAGRDSLTVRFCPELPPHSAVHDVTASIVVPPMSLPIAHQWEIVAQKRGTFDIPHIHLESPSPLHLWDVRRTLPLVTEVRVYPNLESERRTVAASFLDLRESGIHSQNWVGRGREFEKLREYVPGDPVEDLHWKATARRGRPITKAFQVERTQEVYVVIDASRLSGRTATSDGGSESSTSGEPMLELNLRAAWMLSTVASRQGDRLGIVAFDDQVRHFLRARNGTSHFVSCRDSLLTLQPRPVSPDFSELAAFLQIRLRQRALLLFLTALDDPLISEEFARAVEPLARQHLVIVLQPRPPGIGPAFGSPGIATQEELFSEFAGQLRWLQLMTLEKKLAKLRTRFVLAEGDRLAIQLIREYLNVKRRQLL